MSTVQLYLLTALLKVNFNSFLASLSSRYRHILKSHIQAPTGERARTILEPGEEEGGGVNHSSREVGGSWKVKFIG